MEKPLLDHPASTADDTRIVRKSASAGDPSSRLTAKATTGRHRISSSFYGAKAYLFLFGLVFTASVSIYKAASQSTTEGGGATGSQQELQQQQHQYAESEASQFAPLRLEQQNSPAKTPQTVVSRENKGTTAATAKPSKQPKDKPLNVVILYADDWRHDDIGIASPHNVVHTPFLDWLSKTKGIRFTHNCVTTSVCWISRATLHTSQYYSRHKATRPKDNEWYQGWGDAFPQVLKKLGYYVGHIGKWHTADFGLIKATYDFERMYFGRHWFPGTPRPIHVTERNEKDALDMLRKRPKDKPFVMTVAFFAPHSWDAHPDQYLPQNETFTLYQGLKFNKTQEAMEASFQRLPQNVFTNKNEGRHRFRGRFDNQTMASTMLANYYRLISGVDAACEKIWKELEAQGVLDETMVIFSTDNGYYHGEHGLAGKWYPHEESIRVPLIVHDPRMPVAKRGTTDDSFTLNIDLAPTILGAANAKKPATYQGRDISELYLPKVADSNNNELSPPWRKEFFYEHPVHIREEVIPASSALVRKDIKYVVWPTMNVEQIFNLTSDPMEEDDQILNPEYAAVHGDMKTRHDFLRDQVGREHTEF